MTTPWASPLRRRLTVWGRSVSAFVAAFALLTPLNGTPVHAATSVPAFSNVQNALALVESSKEFGTAFCISSDNQKSIFLTSRHVVGSDKSVRLFVQGRTNKVLIARVLRIGEGLLDVAVLEVDYPNIFHLPLSSVGASPGTSIGVAGYPKSQINIAKMRLGLSPSVHAGTVSATVGNGYYLEFDAQTEPGNSGGPVFDSESGLVYGIVTYKLGDRETNIAIATSGLITFVQNAGVVSAFSRTVPISMKKVSQHDTYQPFVDGWSVTLVCDSGARIAYSMRSFPLPGWPKAMRVLHHIVNADNASADGETLEADDGSGNVMLLGTFTNGKLVRNVPLLNLPVYPAPSWAVSRPNGVIRKYVRQIDLESGGASYESAHVFRNTTPEGLDFDDEVFGLNAGLIGFFMPSLDADPHVTCLIAPWFTPDQPN